jgi:cullin 1
VTSPAAQLYTAHEETIRTYLQKYAVPSLRDKHDVQLLQEFVRRWDLFKIMSRWMSSFLRYLDRFHVSQNNLLPLSESALQVFKLTVFEAFHPNVTAASLKLIAAERQGEAVDQTLLKKVVDVYRALGAYAESFEHPRLSESRGFFSARAQHWLSGDSTPQYLLKVEELIESEKARVQAYMLGSTEPLIVASCANELLKEQETALLEKEGSGCRALLRDDKKEDLARVFRMFSKVPDGLAPVAKIVQEHVEDAGRVVLKSREAKTLAPDFKDSVEAPEFVKELLELHERYRTLVTEQFSGDPLFQKALKTAVEATVNQNIGKHKTAELLSSYADSMLKSGGDDKLSDAQVEDVLENIVQLFTFLEDKDVFAEVYRNQLAKRLLNQRSVSHDAERAMIAKLKLRCGAQFTSKHEGMLTDLNLGQDLQTKFRAFVDVPASEDKKLPIDFSAEILTMGHWPTYQILKPTLPTAMARCLEVFKLFYDTTNQYRVLNWVHSLGHATVKVSPVGRLSVSLAAD